MLGVGLRIVQSRTSELVDRFCSPEYVGAGRHCRDMLCRYAHAPTGIVTRGVCGGVEQVFASEETGVWWVASVVKL